MSGLFFQARFDAVRAFVDESKGLEHLEPDQQTLLSLIDRFATIGPRGALFLPFCRARELKNELASVAWNDFSRYQVRLLKFFGSVELTI